MKTNKPPEDTQLTPPAKKLKQARLPFKLISDVSPKPTSPETRKRKLSVPDEEPATKVGKLSKENGFVEDLVVISDDDSKDSQKLQNEEKPLNPFVKLVDTAWKKKLHKSNTSKKKIKNKSSNKQSNVSLSTQLVDSSDSAENADQSDGVEMVEVEVEIHTNEENDIDVHEDKTSDVSTNNDKKTTCSPQEYIETKDVTDQKSTHKNDEINEIVCLEDSNSSEIKILATNKTDTMQTTSEINGTETVSKEILTKSDVCQQKELDTKENPVTPKRSIRSKAKVDDTNLNASSSSKLNESSCSDPSTPKTTRSSSVTSGDKSVNESTTPSNLTPKQLQKKLESAKRKEDKEKERQEREIKKQQEKEEKAKQRQEKEEQKKREREEKEEAKRKEKEEKEEQKKKERDEKEKQKETEKKLKELKEEQKKKEREEKEEQRKKEKEARDEEKRKKQEAAELEKQELELKKKKAAEAFASFFVPKQKEEKDQTNAPTSKSSVLSSFTIKVDMRLAPTVRVDLTDEKREVLDQALQKQNFTENDLYLKCLKKPEIKPLSSGKTWPLDDKDDDDVMIVEDELPPIIGAGEATCDPVIREKYRPKLLSFHSNRRPPYWGTWRKKSAFIKPRRPFGQDEKQLDYEVDSDDDWEEEQEGESLDGSACGSDDEQDAAGDDYEVDNELFVPHGYLSDEEATMEEDDVLSLSPEAQKAKLKHLEDEFESEMKKQTEKLKPRLYGLLWETKEAEKPPHCVDALWNYFGKFAMIMNDPTPLLQPVNEPKEVDKKKVNKKKKNMEGEEQSPKTDKKRAKSENKDNKKSKTEAKKNVPNQPGINSFLTKMKTT